LVDFHNFSNGKLAKNLWLINPFFWRLFFVSVYI
jgi:hypothetical protein